MQRHALVVAVHQQHRQRQALAEQLGLAHGLQQFAEVTQLVGLPGVFVARRIELVIAFQLTRQHPHQPFDGVQRHRVLLVGALHHQCTVHRDAERQADLEVHALPRDGVDAHGAAQLPHLFVNHVHAHAAPGNLGDLFRRGKARLEDELQHVAITDRHVRLQQATLDRLAPYCLERHPCTVVTHIEDDVAAFMGQLQSDQPLLRLAGGTPPLGAFQTVVDGVAQHVLQGRDHALQHIAVHFALGIANDKIDLLAQLPRHLPDDTLEARHQALEWHHARAHQAFLQLGVDPRLLRQQVFRILVAPGQGLLEVQQVGGGFEQGPGQLLQLRVPVHFQRIEFFITQALGFHLLATENPPLGLGVEAAQLVAHTLDGGLHFVERDPGVVDLLLDTATEDRGFARQVDQVFEHVRRNLDHVLGRPLGLGDRRGLGLGRCRRDNRGGDRQIDRRLPAKRLDILDQRIGGQHRLFGTHRVEHMRQPVVAGLQQAEQFRPRLQQPGRQPFVEKFQLVGQIADRHDFHHARAALEGVQVAQQGFHVLAIRRLSLPAQQGRAGAFEDIEAFFEEDLQQLRIVAGHGRGRFGGVTHLQRRAAALAKLAQALDQRTRIAQGLMPLELLEQDRQAVMAFLQQQRQLGRMVEAPVHQPFVEIFQLVGQIAHRADLGHARAALEGVQVPLQGQQRRGVVRIVEPALQGQPGTVEDIRGFFEEDHHDLVVEVHFIEGLARFGGGGAQFGDAQGAAAVSLDQAGGGRVEGLVEQLAQGPQPFRPGLDFLAGGQLVEHVDQGFMGALRLMEKSLADRQAAFFDRTIEVEQGFAEFVHRVQVGTVGALAEGGQFVQQVVEFLALAGVLLPAQQQVLRVQQDIHALGQEVVDQLGIALGAAGNAEQRLQPGREQGFGSPDQFRGAVDRCQGIVRQLFQALMQQHLGLQQQLDLIQVQRQQVSLELAHQVVKRCRQFGDRPHARHIGAALEGVQRPLQFVAGRQRQMFGGLFEKMVEAVQMRLGLVAENIQQLPVDGLVVGLSHVPGRGFVRSRTRQLMGAGGQQVDIVALALGLSGKLADQFRQHLQHIVEQLVDRRVGHDAMFEYTVEQVLHGPGQLTQHQRPDHPAAALERVESATQLGQGRFALGIQRPARQVFAQHIEHFRAFLQEDFT